MAPISFDENADLREKILAENDYVKALIDSIPPQYYFGSDVNAELVSKQHERVHNQLKRKKKNAKLSATNTFKRMKLDPNEHKTVTQMQKEMAEEDEEDVDEDEVETNVKKVSFPGEDRMKLLRKLQEKVDALRGNRKNSKEWVEKRREKRRLSKMKLRMKRKNEKTSGNLSKGLDKTEMIPKKELKSALKKPVYNEEGKMVFSKFDFAEAGEKKKVKGPAGKDYKQLIQKVKREKNKLKEMEEKDPEKALSLKEKQSWVKAMQKAEGIKVKDDVEQLKKSLKKKEKRVNKSKKEWKEREDNVKEKLEKKQKKRTDNIKARKQEKIKKKVKRAMKKGRYIPV